MAQDRTKVVTPVFRVSFPELVTAKSFDGGAAKFSIVALFNPAKFTEAEKRQWAAMARIADESSQAKFGKPVKSLPSNYKRPMRDGSEKADLDGYGEGVKFCTLSSRQRPGIVNLNREEVDPADVYAGCYARATIVAYAYDNKAKGVAFGLNNLQFVRDGESFSGRTNAADDFADAEPVIGGDSSTDDEEAF